VQFPVGHDEQALCRLPPRNRLQQTFAQFGERPSRISFAGSQLLHESFDERFDLRSRRKPHERHACSGDHQAVGLRFGQDVLEHQLVGRQSPLKCSRRSAITANEEPDAISVILHSGSLFGFPQLVE
jgi:hypothetical protein